MLDDFAAGGVPQGWKRALAEAESQPEKGSTPIVINAHDLSGALAECVERGLISVEGVEVKPSGRPHATRFGLATADGEPDQETTPKPKK